MFEGSAQRTSRDFSVAIAEELENIQEHVDEVQIQVQRADDGDLLDHVLTLACVLGEQRASSLGVVDGHAGEQHEADGGDNHQHGLSGSEDHKQHFGDDISVVHHDSYYKYQDRPFEERCKQNYDHPDAFETDLMVEQLKELKAGKAIRCPVYSYADHQRTNETELIRPSKVVIVEGILIFQDPRLREMLDIKIFVETDADVRILRRALRDVRDRGRTLESVITQYLTTVKPMHEQFVEPSRKYADIIVLEGGHNLVALDMIMQRIASHIASAD